MNFNDIFLSVSPFIAGPAVGVAVCAFLLYVVVPKLACDYDFDRFNGQVMSIVCSFFISLIALGAWGLHQDKIRFDIQKQAYDLSVSERQGELLDAQAFFNDTYTGEFIVGWYGDVERIIDGKIYTYRLHESNGEYSLLEKVEPNSAAYPALG